MHPIFQWLDYTYDDYGGFGRVVDDRKICGFRNRLVAGVNIHNGADRQPAIRQRPAGDQGRTAVVVASTSSKNTSAYVENSFYFLPNVAAVVGTQFLRASRATHRPFPVERRSVGRKQFRTSGARNTACSGMSIRRPRRSMRISRAAPKCRASAKASRRFRSSRRTCRIFRSRTIKAQRATTYEIGTRGRRPDYYMGHRALSIRNPERAAMSLQHVRQLQRDQCRSHHSSGLRIRHRRAMCSSPCSYRVPTRTSCGCSWPIPITTSISTTIAMFGNNELPGDSAAGRCARSCCTNIRRACSSGRMSNGFRKAYFVDSVNSLTTDPYMLWGLQGWLRARHQFFVLRRGPQSREQGLYREREHHRRCDPTIGAVRAGHRTRRVRRHENEMVMA